ncbi:EAL domain-containing protein [Flaviflagellibacter deserti]|uniref:EAL domain-containing protein n=1 Tax=Flaviflagellibacter deserti TaxID=2267266 RepID=A0ABV9Z2Y3_9HYPH
MRLTRQITACLLIGCAITFLTVGAMTVWMARQYDAQAAAAAQIMMAGNSESAHYRLKNTTDDYSWWDDAYLAYARGDRDWLNTNVGTGISETAVGDVMVIASPDGKIVYGWTSQENETLEQTITATTIRLARQVLADVPLGPTSAKTMLARGPAGVLMIGAGRLTPKNHAGVDVSRLPILIIGRYQTPERISRVGRSFLLDDLAVSDTPVPGKDFRPLLDPAKQRVGYLVWTPPRPGAALLQELLVPLGIALTVFAVVMLFVATRARGFADELAMAARLDHLTGLDNRKGLSDFLASKACQDEIGKGGVAVIYVDVNGFKTVNDSVGHKGGDVLVREVAARLIAATPGRARVARVGGDEFVVVLVGDDAENVVEIANCIPVAMEKPFVVAEIEFNVSCAVGYARGTDAEGGADALLQRADLAMYQAKQEQRLSPVAYTPSMETDALARKQFEAKLRNAIEAGELHIVYQPIASTIDMRVCGLEALVRWHSPELGDVPPQKLIAVAEESGLIRSVGDFVLNRVCEDSWRWPNLKLSVNVSPAQLRDVAFVSRFRTMLRKHGVTPGQIEIELTETVLLKDPAPAARKLEQLRNLGITVALDDFGTGFSSISSLRAFPLDRLKIDRSFVQDLGTDPDAATLIQSFVAVARAKRLSVVCEGVETETQAEMIRLLDCDFIQGYLLARPMRVEQMAEFLAGEELRTEAV